MRRVTSLLRRMLKDLLLEDGLVDKSSRGTSSLPPRPFLPPVLAVALGMWAACALAFSAAETWTGTACAAFGLAGALGAVLAGVAVWRLRSTALWCAVLGLALGVFVGGVGGALQHGAHAETIGLRGVMRFEMAGDGMSGAYGASCFAWTVLPSGRQALVQLQFAATDEVPRYGEVFEGNVSFSSPQGTSASYCWSNGAVAVGSADGLERLDRHDALGALLAVRNRGIEAILDKEGDEAAVLAALVCGWRDALDDDASYGAFKTTGLAHLIAVSGAHLIIVTAFAGALLKGMRVPRVLAIVLQAALILGYLALSAAPPSAVRAAVMAFVGMGSFVAARRSSTVSALAVCILAFITLSPPSSVSVSFALSALSTLGIALFCGLISTWISLFSTHLPRMACDALSLTLASAIMAVPLSAALFSQVSLVSPLANVVTAPLFPLVCAGGLAATLAASAFPQMSFLVSAAVACTAVLIQVVELVASVPYASIPVDVPFGASLAVTALLSAALWLGWPEPRVKSLAFMCGAAICLAAVFVFLGPRLAGTEVIMLDVGQGDAFVLRSGSAAILVDTGNQDRLLREGLARHGIYRIDAVAITHGDDDHCGSLSSLKGIVQVDRVLVSRETLSCGCSACESLLTDARSLVGEEGVSGLSKGDRIQCGVFDLRVVWPVSFSDAGGNADSLCFLAAADIDADGVGDWRALMVGDAEREQLAHMIEGGIGPVDLYKVGHHGSKNALGAAEAEKLAPSVAFVSCGEGNRYGHPAPTTIETLENAGARVFRSDTRGDVSCKLSKEGARVVSLR